MADNAAPTEDRAAALAAVAGALRRESHVLRERPEILWQQLYNRLQWEEGPFADRLASEWKRRSRPGARPWIHRYTHLRESEALVRTTAAAHSQGRFRGNDPTARCPACREPFPVDRAQLGTETSCPNTACNRALRLNQFTLH